MVSHCWLGARFRLGRWPTWGPVRRGHRNINHYGGLPEWPKGAGCKPAGLRLRWFESNTLHPPHWRHCDGIRSNEAPRRGGQICWVALPRGSSSVGRASAFQAERRGFESRLPLSGDSLGIWRPQHPAHLAQSVERVLGKDEVTSSILVVGSKANSKDETSATE